MFILHEAKVETHTYPFTPNTRRPSAIAGNTTSQKYSLRAQADSNTKVRHEPKMQSLEVVLTSDEEGRG